MKKRFILICCALFSINLFSAFPSNEEWIAQLGTNYVSDAFNTATQEKYPNADSIILADTTVVEYNEDGTYIEANEYYIKANTHAGVEEMRTQAFWYDSSYSNFEIGLVELIKPAGAITFDPKKVTSEKVDDSQMNSNIYDPNSRQILIIIPDFEVGDIIHIKVIKRTHKARFPNFFADIFSLETSYPILRYRYLISGPESLPLQAIATRNTIKEVDFTKEKENGRINYCWQVSDVPQAFPEPDMPAMYSCVGRGIVSTAKNWEEISKWYWELCEEPLNAITAEMEAEVQQLIAGTEENSLERLYKVFTFVSQKIRYMGVTTETVAPGYEPHPVSMTFENKHGVCRDKAALLVTMLRLAGFDSYPVLIMVGEKLDSEIPITFFNHAVVAVKFKGVDEYILMDPTNESTLELFPEYLCEKSYLVATPDGEKLRVSPSIDYRKNMVVINTSARLEIGKDGTSALCNGHTTIDFKGLNDTMYRGFFVDSNKKSIQSFLRKNLTKVNPKLILRDYQLFPEDPSDTSKPLRLELFYDMASPLPKLIPGAPLALDVPQFSEVFGVVNMVMPDTSLLTRRFPLKIYSTCGNEEKITIQLPKEFAGTGAFPDQLSEIDVASGPFVFKYNTQLLTDTEGAPKLQLDLATAITNREIPPEEYEMSRQAIFTEDFKNEIMPILGADAISAAKENSFSDTVQVSTSNGMQSVESDGAVFELQTMHVSIDSATSEVVINRKQRVKLLDRAAKALHSDVTFDFCPKYEKLSILNAATIKASGERIYSCITNLMDKTGSLPAYPQQKVLVLNFPNTEIGDAVEYELERRIPVEYFSGLRLYLALFSPIIEGHIEFDIESIKAFIEKNPEKGYQLDLFLNTQGGKKISYDKANSNFPTLAPKKRLPSPEENIPANFLIFDNYVFRTQPPMQSNELAQIIKARDGEQAIGKAQEKAKELKEMQGDSATALSLLTAVRDYTAKYIRRAGQSFSNLTKKDYLSPDKVLEVGYANDFDYAFLQYIMLKELGLEPRLLLGISKLRASSPEKLISTCILTDVDLVLVEVEIDGKKYYPNIGSQYAIEMSLTSKYCGVPLFDRDAVMFVKSYSDTFPLKQWKGETHTHLVVDIDREGMATISNETSYSGQNLEPFVSMFSELLPELRERHHAQLVGQYGRSANAIGDLEVDIASIPATEEYKLRMELPTLNGKASGQVLQYTMPLLKMNIPYPDAFMRNYPMQRNSVYSESFIVEVLLPIGVKPLAIPEPYNLEIGDNCENVVVSRTVEEKYEKASNRYRYIITHRVKLNQMEDTFTPEEFLDYSDAILRLRSYNNSFIFEK